MAAAAKPSGSPLQRHLRPRAAAAQVLLPAALALGLCGCGGARQEGGAIAISGSSTVFPIIEKARQAYAETARSRGVRITLNEVGTSAGLREFCNGAIPIANASRPISSKELKACAGKGITFIELPLAFDALTVVVNPANTWATAVSTEQLARTWGRQAQGRVRRWNQIDAAWPDRPLRLCGPGRDSGTFDYFNEAIQGDKADARTDVESSEDDNVIVSCVAGDANAMGYFGFAYYQANAERLKALPVASAGGPPVIPSVANAQNGSYKPLSRPLFLYVNDQQMRSNDEIRRFVGFTVSHGLRFVEQAGAIPLPPDTYRLVESKLYRHILGTSFGGDLPVGLGIGEALRRSFAETRKPQVR
jgi:phosphate transport system substrate-binding protein